MGTPPSVGFSVRTITAGIELGSLGDLQPVEEAVRFLEEARTAFEESGLPVQSIRIATQPLGELIDHEGPAQALERLAALDRFMADRNLLISLGPLNSRLGLGPDFPSWAADLVAATNEIYFSLAVTDGERRVLPEAISTAAKTILSISRDGGNGEANFRFGAAAGVPASTPFFPVAYHLGPTAFSIALESADLVGEAFASTKDLAGATSNLRDLLETRIQPVEDLATAIGESASRRFAGTDLSPAPSLESSIAGPIESLSGHPFGDPTTLAVCGSITEALKTTGLESCGYSGLMLPLLEDLVLAERASEHRFGVQHLLLYSAICGTGLDVVPLAGDCPVEALGGLILDLATLATRLDKPLAARLLPIPGKQAGDWVDFANPHLTSSTALPCP